MMAAIAFLSGASNADHSYHPSALQQKVDRSFSDIAIETPLAAARLQLREERLGGCADPGECDWIDRAGVRHYFRGDRPGDNYLVLKSVRAADFVGRAIPALGIGTTRDLREVMERVERFASGARFDCDGETTGPVSCSATLDPGWVTINFDRKGKLVDIRFDGFHFT